MVTSQSARRSFIVASRATLKYTRYRKRAILKYPTNWDDVIATRALDHGNIQKLTDKLLPEPTFKTIQRRHLVLSKRRTGDDDMDHVIDDAKNDDDIDDEDEDPYICGECVSIQSTDMMLDYCNVSVCWVPRLSPNIALLITLLPVGVSATASLYGLSLLVPGLNREFKRLLPVMVGPNLKASRTLKACVSTVKWCWDTVCVLGNVYLLTIFNTFFEVFDVYMDFSLAYRFEMGDIIYSSIYRNPMITNFIFLFACLGVVKIAINLYILRSKSDYVSLFVAKNLCYCIGFLFEDCGEMFLEYFYIEKFLTESMDSPWSLLTRNAIYSILSIRLLIWHGVETGKRCYSKEQKKLGIAFFGTSIIIGITSLLRTGSGLYHNYTGSLEFGCLEVSQGRLIQTPFTSQCLSLNDRLILVLNFIPILFIPVVIVYYIKKNRGDDCSLYNGGNVLSDSDHLEYQNSCNYLSIQNTNNVLLSRDQAYHEVNEPLDYYALRCHGSSKNIVASSELIHRDAFGGMIIRGDDDTCSMSGSTTTINITDSE